MSDITRTVEGLDALPDESIVLDREGDAWRKSGRWWLVGARDLEWGQAASEVAKYAPLRPIHIPGRDLIREAKAEALREAAREAECIRAAADSAESAAHAPGEIGRQACIDAATAMHEESWTWLDARADRIEKEGHTMSDIIERAARVAFESLEAHHEECRLAVREACGFDLGPAPNRGVEVWTIARALADAGLLWPEVTDEMVERARTEYDRSESISLALEAALGVAS